MRRCGTEVMMGEISQHIILFGFAMYSNRLIRDRNLEIGFAPFVVGWAECVTTEHYEGENWSGTNGR
jgi:hypothetical protein